MACEPLEIETGLVTHAEIRTAIKHEMKNGKAGGVDGMTTVAVLYELLLKI